jgi:hypothetical protein
MGCDKKSIDLEAILESARKTSIMSACREHGAAYQTVRRRCRSVHGVDPGEYLAGVAAPVANTVAPDKPKERKPTGSWPYEMPFAKVHDIVRGTGSPLFDMASLLETTEDELREAIEAETGLDAGTWYDRQLGSYRVQVRMWQVKIAKEGSMTMAAWLGRQDLGQSEKKGQLELPAELRRITITQSEDEVEPTNASETAPSLAIVK